MPKFIERDPPPDWAVVAPQEKLLREHLNRWIKRVNAFFEVVEKADYAEPHAVYGRVEDDLHHIYNFIDRLDTEEEFSSTLWQLVRTVSELEILTEKLQYRVEAEYAEIGVVPTSTEEYALKMMPESLAKLKHSVALLKPSHVAMQGHLEMLIVYGSFFPKRAGKAAFAPLREAHAQYFRHSELTALESYRDHAQTLVESQLYRRYNQRAMGNRVSASRIEPTLEYFWEQLEVQTLLSVIES